MKTIIQCAGALTLAALLGCGGQSAKNTGGSTQSNEVQITVTDRGFEPAVSKVPTAKPLTLVVTRKTDQTCATEMVFPALDRRVDLPLNRTVRFEIPGGVADTLNYECGMSMIKGMLVAE